MLSNPNTTSFLYDEEGRVLQAVGKILLRCRTTYTDTDLDRKPEAEQWLLPFSAISKRYTHVRVSDATGRVLAECRPMFAAEPTISESTLCERPHGRAKTLNGVWHSIVWLAADLPLTDVLVLGSPDMVGQTKSLSVRFYDGENLLTIV